jgi:hypothetical protein
LQADQDAVWVSQPYMSRFRSCLGSQAP